MATSNYFQSQKTLFFLLTFLLLLFNKVNSIDPVIFSFENFQPDGQDSILLQGDAHITPKGQIQLTKVEGGKPISNSLGRALYSHPIQIWDSNTGHIVSFATEFNFIINAPNIAKIADGLAFFLAPVDTQPQKPGGYLGLFNSSNVDKSSKTIAVEFDTFLNEEWDTGVPHIGIDVNSITSINSTSWDFANGQLANVEIAYYGDTKTLAVSLNYPPNETSYTVETVVDLREVLPEWVRVGFSATTGLVEDYVETHDVLAWGFVSWHLFDSRSSEAFKNKARLTSSKMHQSN